jgi:hypothetical protein
MAKGSDLRIYRRLRQQARPYWWHLAGVFGVGLLATPLSLLRGIECARLLALPAAPWRI